MAAGQVAPGSIPGVYIVWMIAQKAIGVIFFQEDKTNRISKVSKL